MNNESTRPTDRHPTTMRYDPDIREYRVTCPCGYAAQVFERAEAEQLVHHHAFYAPRESRP